MLRIFPKKRESLLLGSDSRSFFVYILFKESLRDAHDFVISEIYTSIIKWSKTLTKLLFKYFFIIMPGKVSLPGILPFPGLFSILLFDGRPLCRYSFAFMTHILYFLITGNWKKSGRGTRFAMNDCRKTLAFRRGVVAPYVPLRFSSKRKCVMNANEFLIRTLQFTLW